MRISTWLVFFLIMGLTAISQPGKGIIIGNILDSTSRKSIPGATVQLSGFTGNYKSSEKITDKNGNFSFTELPFGYYRVTITAVGLTTLKIDSIHLREERFDFNLADIQLSTHSKELETVIIYSEKPLIQSKDGNITFNAGESALAAGTNASELLNNTPLVTKDPSGKILVRGKEPKILIDDKPIELNLQQLQDLLESLPGSSIEKIEVLTNPPPQYANEPGGVINITTRKGRVGMGARMAVSAGTRGEGNINWNFNYRKNKIALNINASSAFNRYEGNGNTERKNMYADSINFFRTKNNYLNKSTRPNLRINLDYEIAKNQGLNFVITYNQNDFNNRNTTGYTHINRFDEIYKLSERMIHSEGDNYNTGFSLTYSLKGKTIAEQLRIFTGANFSITENNRLFYQQFFNPDHSPNGIDSTQQQLTDNHSNGYYTRIQYDKPLANKKTFLSLGTAYNRDNSHIEADANYEKKPEGVLVRLELLSNNFKFHRDLTNFRASIKQLLGENFSITTGLAAEATTIHFDLLKEGREVSNSYWNFLPFGNINKHWKDKLNLTFSYRRTIRRPGIFELNPTVDFSDPYNIRFGNYQLDPSLAHNFDLVAGRTRPKYFVNIGTGFNLVQDIFSQLRTLLPDGKTQVTWENISNRKEYELSTWNGITITKRLRTNLSASYTFNEYSLYDRQVRKFRNGSSFTTNLNGTYTIKDIWNYTGSFTLNRFANPQGSVSWNLSMNVGVQRKFFDKRFIVTLNFIDPFRNQLTHSYTYGQNFELKSFTTTQTKNFRLTLAYNFKNLVKKKRVEH